MKKHVDGLTSNDEDQETVQVSQVSNDLTSVRAYPGNGIYARRMQRRNAPLLALKFIRHHQESILYFIFALCLTFGCLLDRSQNNGFYMADAVRGRLMATAWPDILELTELWNFLEVDFIQFVYKSYFPGSNNSTIMGYNYIMNGVRLRQIRVSPSVCSGPSWLNSLVPGQTSLLFCYPKFTHENEDRQSFGFVDGGPWFTYSKGDERATWKGELGQYGGDGFVLDLPTVNISEAKLRIGRHKTRGWLDLQSRALFIDFSLYNPESSLLLRARLLIEFSEFGGLIKSQDFSVYQLQKYGGRDGSIALTLDIFFLVIAVFYLAVEMIALVQMKGRYFLVRPSGFLNFLIAFICFAIIAIRLESKNQIDSQFYAVKSASEEAPTLLADLQNLPYLKQQDDNLVAILFIVIYARLFAYVGDIPGVNHLIVTIKRCIIEVIPLLSLVVINFVGFSLAFHVIFGLKIHEYRTVASSFVSNALFLLGETSLYAQMYDSNKDMAGFVCAIFVVSENILLFNLFTAILVHAYAMTKTELEKEPIAVFSEAIESALKLLSKAGPEQRVQPSNVTRGKNELDSSGFSSGWNNGVEREGDLRLNASLQSKGAGSPLAFSSEQAIKTVSSRTMVGSQAVPSGVISSTSAMEESLLEISQGVASFDTIKIQLMAISEKLNALTDFFLSQPAIKTELHVELINRKLDLLAEALVSTQYRGSDANMTSINDGGGESHGNTSLGKSLAGDRQTPSSQILRPGLRTMGRGSGRVPGWTE